MEQNALISVIVPVYNVQAYLPRCVDSILNQEYGNLEVILVDDGATDESGAICDAYAARDSRVRVIHKPNGGLSSARNAGIDAATGEYLAFVDSDDWIEPDTYGYMLRQMVHGGAKLACAGRYDVNGETGDKKIGLCPQREEVISAEEMVGRIFVWDNCDSSACDKLYHRSLLETFRYPEGKVCEDVPVTYLIVLKAGMVAMCNRPVYNYYHRPGSITTASVSEKTFHFSQHTGVIYPYICQNHPAIAPQARYLRVRSLVYDLLTLDLAGKQTRSQYSRQYAHSRKALSKHTLFFMKSNLFSRQEKLTNLLLVLGMYLPFRKIYHKLK